MTNTYDKENKKEYVNFKVFDFEMADEAKPSTKQSSQQVSGNPFEGDNDEGESPF